MNLKVKLYIAKRDIPDETIRRIIEQAIAEKLANVQYIELEKVELA